MHKLTFLIVGLLVSLGLGLTACGTAAIPEPVQPQEAGSVEESTPTTAEFVLQFDGEPDRLETPVGIDIDQQGNLYVYVADRKSEFRIQKFDRDGKLLTKWGKDGLGDGRFYANDSLHSGLSIDGQGNVYATDGDNGRIQKFDSNGQFLTQWGRFRPVGREINVPHDVTVDAQGNVYVIDCRMNHLFRVLKFDGDGKFLTEWNISESEWTSDEPSIHIAVGGDGNVYVSNDRAHHVQKFDGDGELLGIIGGPGSGDGQFNTPGGIAVDGQGNLYVADMGNNRIQKFDSSGDFLFKWGSEGVGDSEFNHPVDVTVDAQGNVYVVDMDNNRIQMFRQM